MPHYIHTLLAVPVLLSVLVVAPFPVGHPYHFLNPFIEPWWHQLDEETQKAVYSVWEEKEPLLLAKARVVDQLARKFAVSGQALVALNNLFSVQIQGLVDTAFGSKEMPPDEVNAGNENEEGKQNVRFKDLAQKSWEDFQSLVQYATYLKLSAKRAKYEALEELVKLKRNGKRLLSKKLDVVGLLLRKLVEPVPEPENQNQYQSQSQNQNRPSNVATISILSYKQ
eukprot:GFUD01019682.1.p1 GENE.GFUD01019682.1~~GFUD01019682.1.p1  ORF type:complete len:225 (-),score=54.16 GFUD01019682.1:10-684(-)